MAKRLIDADAMRQDWLENGENEYVYDTNAVLESIDEQPTVDAVEVVHGEWKLIGADKRGRGGIWKCTACGGSHPHQSKYCSDCGAKMDGERKENEK